MSEADLRQMYKTEKELRIDLWLILKKFDEMEGVRMELNKCQGRIELLEKILEMEKSPKEIVK
jgi:hypothetical protein